MRREWKVGERCWVFVDEKAVAGRIGEFEKGSGCYRVEFNGVVVRDLWAWRNSTAIYETRLDALIDDAKGDVYALKIRNARAVRDAKDVARRAKQTARHLEKAEKRLAALRAKGGAK